MRTVREIDELSGVRARSFAYRALALKLETEIVSVKVSAFEQNEHLIKTISELVSQVQELKGCK